MGTQQRSSDSEQRQESPCYTSQLNFSVSQAQRVKRALHFFLFFFLHPVTGRYRNCLPTRSAGSHVKQHGQPSKSRKLADDCRAVQRAARWETCLSPSLILIRKKKNKSRKGRTLGHVFKCPVGSATAAAALRPPGSHISWINKWQH